RRPALSLVAVARGALERGKELLSIGGRASGFPVGATRKCGKNRQSQSRNEKRSHHMVYTGPHRKFHCRTSRSHLVYTPRHSPGRLATGLEFEYVGYCGGA